MNSITPCRSNSETPLISRHEKDRKFYRSSWSWSARRRSRRSPLLRASTILLYCPKVKIDYWYMQSSWYMYFGKIILWYKQALHIRSKCLVWKICILKFSTSKFESSSSLHCCSFARTMMYCMQCRDNTPSRFFYFFVLLTDWLNLELNNLSSQALDAKTTCQLALGE